MTSGVASVHHARFFHFAFSYDVFFACDKKEYPASNDKNGYAQNTQAYNERNDDVEYTEHRHWCNDSTFTKR